MELDETMMVAGIGCRKGVDQGQVLAAVEAALATHGLSAAALSALATAHFKHAEDAIAATGKTLKLPLLLVDDAALRAVSLRALTRSVPSLQATGTPSISETAALAAAGQHATLLGPRIAVGPVTCAIAVAGDVA
ncbi:cobalamin biosynthesis protein [Ollibium composti]|jgi:cobalt-precorrin 5A hydrolase